MLKITKKIHVGSETGSRAGFKNIRKGGVGSRSEKTIPDLRKFHVMAKVFTLNIYYNLQGQFYTGQEILNKEPMERFDQGNLHHKLEVPELTYLGWESKPDFHGGMRALYN